MIGKIMTSFGLEKWLGEIDGKWLMQVERWPRGALSIPRIQSHRGYCKGGEIENTLPAFRQSRQHGALMVETDVRLTKDQVPVLFHDENLQRLAGVLDPLELLTLSELRQKFKVTTLQELLIDTQSPRLVNIELKTKSVIEDPLERKVAEVVKHARAESRVLFSSFNPFSLYRIGLHLPDVPRAMLISPEDEPDNSILLRKMLLAPFFSFHLLHLDQQMVNEVSMKIWRRKKIPVSVWTVNGKENVSHFLQLGALSVISDDWNS